MTENEFMKAVQEIGQKNHTFKYENHTDIRNQKYKRISKVPSDLSEMIWLFKGLVLCEKDFNWMGGSVASNISVYRRVVQHPDIKHDMERLDELLDWALKNRGQNPYTPLDSHRYRGCKSLMDKRIRDKELRDTYIKNMEAERQIQIKKDQKIELHKQLNQLKQARQALNYQSYRVQIELFLLNNRARQLFDLINHKIKFPINLLPIHVWEKIIILESLGIDQIRSLIKVIPKNTTDEIKSIKRRLISLKEPLELQSKPS